jgi:hypothetical protein
MDDDLGRAEVVFPGEAKLKRQVHKQSGGVCVGHQTDIAARPTVVRS